MQSKSHSVTKNNILKENFKFKEQLEKLEKENHFYSNKKTIFENIAFFT